MAGVVLKDDLSVGQPAKRALATILQGDALEQMRTLPAESVQCCVTSPPYYGLRDYGTGQWAGGDEDCGHDTVAARGGRGGSGAPGKQTIGATPSEFAAPECGKCGATRTDAQIGLEASPAEYIDKLVAVFREVRRVLRKDGVLWCNLGDSYAGHNLPGWRPGNEAKNQGASNKNGVGYIDGLKPKDLMGMPWRLAFALQADGWYLRQDIIWAKPNPMPESVTDRCTKAHEYIFLLSKSERYFFDAGAIAEPFADERGGNPGAYKWSYAHDAETGLGVRGGGGPSTKLQAEGWNADGNKTTRNKRSVWTIATEPYPDAHFATFPTELPRLCILAGSKAGDTILDPFNGSGTTGQVALELSRGYIGVELNPAYVALTEKRLRCVTYGLPLEAAA